MPARVTLSHSKNCLVLCKMLYTYHYQGQQHALQNAMAHTEGTRDVFGTQRGPQWGTDVSLVGNSVGPGRNSREQRQSDLKQLLQFFLLFSK